MTLTKNEIKFVKSLQIKKYRDSHQLFVVEGEKLVNELLSQSIYKIDTIFHTQEFDLPSKSSSFNAVEITEKDLARISSLKSPNKVLATAKIKSLGGLDLDSSQLILLLDNVKDPGNMGTIIRTAEWFGIHQIIASAQSVDIYNTKVIQASMGAFYHINFMYGDLEKIVPELKEKDFIIAGASLTGTNIYESTLFSKTALVMGSESHGISEPIIKLLDQALLIPKKGHSESLNVGIATGVFLSEYYRQFTSLQR